MSCCFIDFESVQRQHSLGGGPSFPSDTVSPAPSTHTLPASAEQVPCLDFSLETVKILRGSRCRTKRHTPAAKVAHAPILPILQVLKAIKHSRPHPRATASVWGHLPRPATGRGVHHLNSSLSTLLLTATLYSRALFYSLNTLRHRSSREIEKKHQGIGGKKQKKIVGDLDGHPTRNAMGAAAEA